MTATPLTRTVDFGFTEDYSSIVIAIKDSLSQEIIEAVTFSIPEWEHHTAMMQQAIDQLKQQGQVV